MWASQPSHSLWVLNRIEAEEHRENVLKPQHSRHARQYQMCVTHIQAFLDETHFLDPLRSGFRPGFVNGNCLSCTVYLSWEKGMGSVFLWTFLTLSEAFDTTIQCILQGRLWVVGGGTVLLWFKSWWDGCFQRVVLGKFCSALWRLEGSFFNIYMKLVSAVIRCFGIHCKQHADDTQLYFFTSAAVLVWSTALRIDSTRAKKVKLNPDRTEALLVGGSPLDGVTLPLMEHIGSLWVFLNPLLSLEALVALVVQSAFLQLWLVA